MYKALFRTISILSLSFFFLAYQDSRPVPDKILDLEEMAYEAMEEGNFQAALDLLAEAKTEMEGLGLEQERLKIIEQELQVWANRTDLDPNTQLEGIQTYWKSPQNQDDYFQQAYYDALTIYYFYLEELDSVNIYHQKAIKILQAQKRWKEVVNSNTFLAREAYVYYADFFMAKKYIDQAEEVLKTKLLPKGEEAPEFFPIHALVLQELGNYDDALVSALKSLDDLLNTDNVDTLDLIYEYNNLGSIYNALEDYTNAEKYFNKVLAISQEYGDPLETSISYYNLGSVFYKKENYEKAFEARSEALKFLKLSGGLKDLEKDYINCYQQLADYYIRKEKLDSATIYVEKALALSKITNYRKQLTFAQKARIAAKKKEYKKAVNFFEQGLALDQDRYGSIHPNVAFALHNIGNAYKDAEEYEKALSYYQKSLIALSIEFDSEDVAKNPEVDKCLDLDLFLKILSLKVNVFQKLKKETPDSISLQDIYPTALLATEVLTRINQKVMNQKAKSYWLKKEAIPTYEQAISLALQLEQETGEQKYLNEAFQLAERSKSVLLMGALQEQNAGAFGGVPDSLIQQEQRLSRLLAQMRKKRFDAYLQKKEKAVKGYDEQIFQLEHENEVLQRELETKFPKYYELKYQDNVITLEDIQKELKDNSVFIEYFHGNEALIAFAIQKDKASSFSMPLQEGGNIMNFHNLLSDVQGAIKNPVAHFNQYVESAHNYYKKWLEPALKETKAERIILIPDGPLGYVPFEALLTKATNKAKTEEDLTDYSKLPYVLHNYQISYNYSGTLWLQQRNLAQKAINGKVLALAPSYSNKLEADSSLLVERSAKEQTLRGGLLELPGAAAEIDLLSQKYKGAFYKGEAAAEKDIKAKASEYGILHLAMHGLVDQGNPEFSSLAMTEDGNPKEDNFFYAYEIKQLDLKASLVVLSACETGAGKYQRGEGVVSIGRGFMYAGAPSLLMTLWSLNDQSSLNLIEHFYDNLSAGMEKDKALQQAKINYLENAVDIAGHPALWACFIQLGNYNSIEIEEKTVISSNLVWVFGGIGMILALGFIAKRSFKKRAA